MKLSISKEAFLKALQMVQPVISGRPVNPIMMNVLIKAQEGKAVFVSMNETMTMRFCVEVEQVQEEGEGVFNARRLLNIVRELPDKPISFSVDDKGAGSIKCASSSSKLYGMTSEDFPVLKPVEQATDVLLDQGVLKQMIANTVYATTYAASGEDSKQVLNGLLISFKEQKLTIVATDGKRLALMEQELEAPVEKNIDMVLPSKTANEWVRLLHDEGKVKIMASSNYVIIETENITLSSKLQEGKFPNYRQVIPTNCEERVVIPREEMLAALRRVSAIADHGVAVKLAFSENELKITSQTPDVGEAEETIAVKYSGVETAVAFNPVYLIEPLRSLVVDEVYFEIMKNSLSPSVIKCDIPFLYVVMPQNI